MATTTVTTGTARDVTPTATKRRGTHRHSQYPYWFYLPAAVIYTTLFLVPTFAAFYFSLTRWSIFESHFIGFGNFVSFFQEPALVKGLINTIIYGVVTSGLKVVLGMLLAVNAVRHREGFAVARAGPDEVARSAWRDARLLSCVAIKGCAGPKTRCMTPRASR